MWEGRASGQTQAPPERRRWPRLPLAVPVFARGMDRDGKPFMEFTTLVNESSGGVLLATGKSLQIGSRISLEIPTQTLPKVPQARRSVRVLRGRVIRITVRTGSNLCGLKLVRPLV